MMFGTFAVIWNLLLVGVAIFFSHRINIIPLKWREFKSINKLAFWVLVFWWAMLFPNIPYLFTQSRHVVDLCALFDANNFEFCTKFSSVPILMFAYGALAVVPFYFCLRNVSRSFDRIFETKFLAKFFPIISMPVWAVGLILGLEGRFNSWEIFSRIDEILKYVVFEMSNFTILTTTLSMYVIYFSFEMGTKFFEGKK